LGWWHYLNGDYQKAVDMLSAVVQQRPGDLNLRLGLAWGQIEIRRYGDALQTLNGAIYEQQIQPERALVRAVANWQAQEHDEAIRDFDITVSGRPEWGNSSWVKALYSPLVAQSTLEMQAERERRKQKVRAAASR
jgi:tetratricopeptide (TPR) repeat protein